MATKTSKTRRPVSVRRVVSVLRAAGFDQAQYLGNRSDKPLMHGGFHVMELHGTIYVATPLDPRRPLMSMQEENTLIETLITGYAEALAEAGIETSRLASGGLRVYR